MVPCDPVTYLNLEYGPNNWQSPDRNFGARWKNLFENGRWSDSEWPNVLRAYDFKGKLMYNYTLKVINEHISPKLSQLPFKENDY